MEVVQIRLKNLQTAAKDNECKRSPGIAYGRRTMQPLDSRPIAWSAAF